MRITHIFHSYYPALGGMERAVQGLTEAQSKMGHEVHVVTSMVGVNDRPRDEFINNIHVHRIRSARLGYPDLTYPLECPKQLLKSSDMVHCHSQNSLFSFTVAKRARELGAKITFYLMAVDALRDYPNLPVRYLGSWYSKRSTEKAVRIADLILVKSYRDQEVLKRNYGFNAIHLPDGVPECYFVIKKADPREFTDKSGIKQEKFFLFVGRLHKLKGPHIFVHALKYINRDVAAVFIGPNGGYGREILKLATRIGVEKRVYVLGYVNEEMKIRALDSATALVIPSIADYVEVYSLVTSEAWARRKRVIASKVGELPYRIKEHINGILVEPSNPILLAKVMSEFLSNDELAREIGEEKMRAPPTWEEVGRRSIELYEGVLNL